MEFPGTCMKIGEEKRWREQKFSSRLKISPGHLGAALSSSLSLSLSLSSSLFSSLSLSFSQALSLYIYMYTERTWWSRVTSDNNQESTHTRNGLSDKLSPGHFSLPSTDGQAGGSSAPPHLPLLEKNTGDLPVCAYSAKVLYTHIFGSWRFLLSTQHEQTFLWRMKAVRFGEQFIDLSWRL